MPIDPRVSVIVPVHNGAAYLAEALQSVAAQTLRALEVIVVDDGSTDGTSELLRRWSDARLRVARQPQQGAGAARNHGVLLARAPYLAFLDADDVWTPTKLALQVNALDTTPELAMVLGHYAELHDGAEPRMPGPAAPGYSSGTLLVRRAAFLKVGLFACAWRVGEFIDWYARATEAGLTHALRPEVVLWRRIHAANSTRAAGGGRQDYARVLAAMLLRRRAQAEPAA
jgi:glycosyltransferase involved in cell wall biosynthesis